MFANNWGQLTVKQVEVIESAANAIKDEFKIEEIIETFEEMGFPLLYDYPGFYGKFVADTDYNNELIEEWCISHD